MTGLNFVAIEFIFFYTRGMIFIFKVLFLPLMEYDYFFMYFQITTKLHPFGFAVLVVLNL